MKNYPSLNVPTVHLLHEANFTIELPAGEVEVGDTLTFTGRVVDVEGRLVTFIVPLDREATAQ